MAIPTTNRSLRGSLAKPSSQFFHVDLFEAFDRAVGVAKKFQRIGRGHSDDLHAGAARRLDSKQGVFKDDTPLRRNPEKFSGFQKNIRRRFAMNNVISADDRIKEFSKSRRRENGFQISARSGRANRAGNPRRFQRAEQALWLPAARSSHLVRPIRDRVLPCGLPAVRFLPDRRSIRGSPE